MATTIINPSDQTITQYNVQTGGASNLLNNVAPSATTGVALISQNATTQPAFGTVVVAGGGTGAVSLTGVLTGNGTSAVTANTVTQHGVLLGGASNAVSSLGIGATGTVLIGNTGADPSFSATPAITSITLSGGTSLSNYTEGTWTPTIVGGGAAGVTTYTSQNGYYTRIGNIIIIIGTIVITAATGTGDALIGGLPFTVKSQTNGNSCGATNINGAGWVWPVGTTSASINYLSNTLTAKISVSGSVVASSFLQMANAALTLTFSGFYQI